MISKKNVLNIALGSAFVATFSAAAVANATPNPFSMQSMNKGYMTAEADMGKMGKKAMEGGCAGKKKMKAGMGEKAKEGGCAGKKKMMDSNHSGTKKSADVPAAM